MKRPLCVLSIAALIGLCPWMANGEAVAAEAAAAPSPYRVITLADIEDKSYPNPSRKTVEAIEQAAPAAAPAKPARPRKVLIFGRTSHHPPVPACFVAIDALGGRREKTAAERVDHRHLPVRIPGLRDRLDERRPGRGRRVRLGRGKRVLPDHRVLVVEQLLDQRHRLVPADDRQLPQDADPVVEPFGLLELCDEFGGRSGRWWRRCLHGKNPVCFNSENPPRRPLRPVEQPVGLVVTRELTFHGVVLQRSLEPVLEVDEAAERAAAEGDLLVADRRLAALDAVEPVEVEAVAAGPVEPHVVGTERPRVVPLRERHSDLLLQRPQLIAWAGKEHDLLAFRTDDEANRLLHRPQRAPWRIF